MSFKVASKMPMRTSMSIGSINPLSYVQSILTSAIQSAGLTTNTNSNSLSSLAATSSVGQTSDNSRLSPFAQMLAELQQLQQSDPAKYTQVTQQIATNLQSAAQTATTAGNTTAATQLNQLATDLTSASKSGQLPSVQDLAQAVGGHHHHHHHAHAASADSGTTTSTDSSSTSSSSSSARPTSVLCWDAHYGGFRAPRQPVRSVTIRSCSPGWWSVSATLRASGCFRRFWRSLAAGWLESSPATRRRQSHMACRRGSI